MRCCRCFISLPSLRRAWKIGIAITRRATNRLKSPDCLLCIFTCTFVYVLCFIFILAIVVRTSGPGAREAGGGSSESLMKGDTSGSSTVAGPLIGAVEASVPAAKNVGGRDKAKSDEDGSSTGRISGSEKIGGGDDSSSADDVLYERRRVYDILFDEEVFSNDTATAGGVVGAGYREKHGEPDPSVLTDTSKFDGYGSQDFKFPLQVDMPDMLQRIRLGKKVSTQAINGLKAPWFEPQKNRCSSPVYLALLVKSHPSNYANREAIRATWGRADCWRNSVRIFFLLGADAAYGIRRGRRIIRRVRDWRQGLAKENAKHGDLLVREFVDHYYNNTLKLMSGVQWSVTECPNAKFTAFVDDDFYVNPYQVERQLDSLSPAVYGRFLGGWVWRTSMPRRRSRKHKSKWDISVSEYPWSTYPPYVAAGAMFISQPVLKDISVAMEYTEYLRFDDIFIGLVAHKLLLTPLHMEYVRAYDSVPSNSTDMQTLLRLVASHGYKQPGDIKHLWQRLHLYGLCLNGEPEG